MTEKPGAALVTGAGRRLGKAMALHLASQGYDLVLHYRNSKEECEALVPTIESFGGQAVCLQADLNEPTQAQPLIEKAFEAFSNLNLLVNNASIFYPKSFLDTDMETFDAFFNVHVKSPFFLMQHFAKHCQQGHIVNLLDTDVTKELVTYFPYLLSKKTLTDLTLMGARALGPQTRVNAIAPGYVLPPEGENEDRKKRLEETLPLRAVGDPTKIQQALQSLLALDYSTGQILYIDGGQHLI